MSDMALGQQGVLQVIPPAQLEQQLQARAVSAAQANKAAQQQQESPQQLVGYIKGQFEIFRNHRNTAAGWSERLLQALRTFNGQYDQTKLMEIRKFGGSDIYARVIAQKCRAASSLLRDIYLSQDRPYAVRPPAQPKIPPNISQSIDALMQQETAMVTQYKGVAPQQSDVAARKQALLDSAMDAARKQAAQQARDSEDKIEDMLRQGRFYEALAEFLVDLPIFPIAILKGPVVRIIPTVVWNNGKPILQQKPTLTWNRVSPFDFWFTPGVASIENANTIEKSRITRGELNDLLDLPGYNQDEIRAVLGEYGRGGLYDNWDTTDAERAVLENRENPAWNRSALISMMEFNGNVQGRLLQDYGLAVPDELRDYHVQAWCVGSHVIKAHLTPSPRQRHPYYVTSFEKVPGTPVGNSLCDLLLDIQDAANGCLRALVNNMSISSGPQCVINDDAMTPGENSDDLYPWKRWHTRRDPLGNGANSPPVEFFMPTSNVQQLMQAYQELIQIADDVSAIPKYVGGQAGAGAAGRTASGLAMLMGNASKILQTVSANVDRDVMEPCMTNLADLIMLTDTSGLLTGEEQITVQGVTVAVQRETLRQRQIEFLQATNNPTDLRIVGLRGRGEVLRSVGSTLGLPDQVVPPENILEKMQEQSQQQQQNGPVEQMIQQGVNKGVEAGIQRITTELTAGEIAQRFAMPEGMPTHIGTPPGPGGQPAPTPGGPGAPPQSATNSPRMNLNASPIERAAAISQGSQKGPLTRNGLGPNVNLTGRPPGPGAKPISAGVG